MRQLRALDLFCGGGAAAIGLQRAGLEVVGVDIKKRPNYPGHFIQADVANLPVDVMDFDFCWASPPCQAFSTARNKNAKTDPPNLIPLTRSILEGHPFSCIENVTTAPIRPDLILNGASVGLQWIQRHRAFELSFFMFQNPLPAPKGWLYLITQRCAGKYSESDRLKELDKGLPKRLPVDVSKTFLGIPYFQKMTRSEIGEAVPPRYAEFIARAAIQQMKNY